MNAMTSPKVLCAVDFEHNSLAAEKLALQYARHLKTGVDFLHTYFEVTGLTGAAAAGGFALPQAIIDSIQEKIEEERLGQMSWRVSAIGANEKDSDINCVVKFGDPVLSLNNYIKHHHPQLLVLSKRRRSFFSEFMLGSVGNRILRDCPINTFIVPDDEQIFMNWHPRQMLVALSFDKGSQAVWRQAQAFASTWGASLKIVHVALSWDELQLVGRGSKHSEFGDEVRKLINNYEAELNKKVETFYKEMNIDKNKVSLEIRRGSVATEIFEAAEKEKADAVIIGASDAGKGHLKTLGSVASTIARSARLPVLVVQEHN